jgi:hypothetical protein
LRSMRSGWCVMCCCGMVDVTPDDYDPEDSAKSRRSTTTLDDSRVFASTAWPYGHRRPRRGGGVGCRSACLIGRLVTGGAVAS